MREKWLIFNPRIWICLYSCFTSMKKKTEFHQNPTDGNGRTNSNKPCAMCQPYAKLNCGRNWYECDSWWRKIYWESKMWTVPKTTFYFFEIFLLNFTYVKGAITSPVPGFSGKKMLSEKKRILKQKR